jgi:signal transduction histidine kinase
MSAPTGNPLTQAGTGGEAQDRQLAKLRKINAALIQRVERSMEQQGNAYALFQTAIGLEAQVRLRTEELKSALRELEDTNQQLIAARDAAERANRFKTRFFTSVGHDLLQPLHAARLTSSALDGSVKPAEQVRLAGQIDHALATIEELLRSILDLSKLEAGVVEPRIQPVSLAGLFKSLITDLGPLAREKGLALTSRQTSLGVTSDPLMLRRIVQNLLANAVRYTERGEVKLAARRRGDSVRIEVWDTGPGIPPQERTRIFEEFERGAASEKAATAGFGLGLSIVRRTAQALGHEVEVCSRVGHGTRFSVLAPLATAVEVQPHPDETPGPARLAYGFAASRVLVLDNDDAVLSAMSTLLDRWGCAARTARDLGQVAAMIGAGAFKPDLALLDYHLDNGECGLAAVAELRRAVRADLPVIVVTADHSSQIADEARRAGCEILCKPVKPAELRALMSHLIG